MRRRIQCDGVHSPAWREPASSAPSSPTTRPAPDRSTEQSHSQPPWSPGERSASHTASRSLRAHQAVANAKRAYQACRYTEVMSQIPTLLPALQAACDNLDGDTRLRASALSADAYHVVASVLLKLGDHGLAWLAADRSMRAATLSQEPLALAPRPDHHPRADGRRPLRCRDHDCEHLRSAPRGRRTQPDPGILVGVRLAAAARASPPRTEELRRQHDPAQRGGQAGSRLGSDYNHRWTAFGPANVLLHRINTAVRLGDAGSAINYARKVNLDRLTVTERKASFFVDTAQAFSQWGKHEKAFTPSARLRSSLPGSALPPAVRRLVGDLLATAPPTIRPHLSGSLPTSGRRDDTAGRGRVLYMIVCGAGPAGEVGRLVELAQDRGWTVQIIATPSALAFIDVPSSKPRPAGRSARIPRPRRTQVPAGRRDHRRPCDLQHDQQMGQRHQRHLRPRHPRRSARALVSPSWPCPS